MIMQFLAQTDGLDSVPPFFIFFGNQIRAYLSGDIYACLKLLQSMDIGNGMPAPGAHSRFDNQSFVISGKFRKYFFCIFFETEKRKFTIIWNRNTFKIKKFAV